MEVLKMAKNNNQLVSNREMLEYRKKTLESYLKEIKKES